MKIRMDGKYRTKSGVEVRRVFCVDALFEKYPVVVEMSNGDIGRCTPEGLRYYSGEPSQFDLVEVNEWEDFKIDDPVMVSNNSIEWRKRHFAWVSEAGQPMAFNSGSTSWSSIDIPMEWKLCRRPTAEELK